MMVLYAGQLFSILMERWLAEALLLFGIPDLVILLSTKPVKFDHVVLKTRQLLLSIGRSKASSLAPSPLGWDQQAGDQRSKRAATKIALPGL